MTEDDLENFNQFRRLTTEGDAKIKALKTMLELLARTDEQLTNALINHMIKKNGLYYDHFTLYKNYLQKTRRETIDAISSFYNAQKNISTMNEEDKIELISNHLLALDEYVKKNNQLINSQPYISESLNIVLKQHQKNIFIRVLAGMQTACKSFVSTATITRPLGDTYKPISLNKLKEYLPITRDASHYDIDARLSDRQKSMVAQINRYISDNPSNIKSYNELKTRVEKLDKDITEARVSKDAGKAMSKFEEMTNVLRELAHIAQPEKHKKQPREATLLAKRNDVTFTNHEKKAQHAIKFGPLLAKISPLR